MKAQKKINKILEPKNQLKLFGYNNLFSTFDRLFKNKKMPNSVLLSGPKGSGKSTFVYHFANYLFSSNEDFSYSIKDYKINNNNKSYNLVQEGIHPNLYFLESTNLNDKVKIEQVRNLLTFTNKSSFSKDLKIIVINNAESLNINSANALLKVIEEPSENTFFFIIHNSFLKISNTIKSRCVEFKLTYTVDEKFTIFEKLSDFYNLQFDSKIILENLLYETPGTLIKYALMFEGLKSDTYEKNLNDIYNLIEKAEGEKDTETYNFLFYLVEKFYASLCFNNFKNFNKFSQYFANYKKIIYQIHNMKNFNLNGKNTLTFIKNNLSND